MAQIDLSKMHQKIRDTQWSLDEIDWEAPGADLITAEQWPRLKAFMTDLMWIEHVGARGFLAMARNAPDDTLREIYTLFYEEEKRHALAELALMKRWGMLEPDGSLAEPSTNLRLAIQWLDRHADSQPFYVLGAIIPMLEIALDGALCKFLLDTVRDPVCHQAFEKINGDEARHLGVGFHVMEMQGYRKSTIALMRMVLPLVDPRMLLGIAVYLPLLNKMRDNMVAMGLPEKKLYDVMRKFGQIGGRTPEGRRNPWFRIVASHARVVMNRRKWHYHVPVDGLVRLIDRFPRRWLRPVPGWVKELDVKAVERQTRSRRP